MSFSRLIEEGDRQSVLICVPKRMILKRLPYSILQLINRKETDRALVFVAVARPCEMGYVAFGFVTGYSTATRLGNYPKLLIPRLRYASWRMARGRRLMRPKRFDLFSARSLLRVAGHLKLPWWLGSSSWSKTKFFGTQAIEAQVQLLQRCSSFTASVVADCPQTPATAAGAEDTDDSIEH